MLIHTNNHVHTYTHSRTYPIGKELATLYRAMPDLQTSSYGKLMHANIHIYIHTYIHTHIHTCIFVFIRTYAHANIHLYEGYDVNEDDSSTVWLKVRQRGKLRVPSAC